MFWYDEKSFVKLNETGRKVEKKQFSESKDMKVDEREKIYGLLFSLLRHIYSYSIVVNLAWNFLFGVTAANTLAHSSFTTKAVILIS